jgi:hypothetical protein
MFHQQGSNSHPGLRHCFMSTFPSPCSAQRMLPTVAQSLRNRLRCRPTLTVLTTGLAETMLATSGSHRALHHRPVRCVVKTKTPPFPSSYHLEHKAGLLVLVLVSITLVALGLLRARTRARSAAGHGARTAASLEVPTAALLPCSPGQTRWCQSLSS